MHLCNREKQGAEQMEMSSWKGNTPPLSQASISALSVGIRSVLMR